MLIHTTTTTTSTCFGMESSSPHGGYIRSKSSTVMSCWNVVEGVNVYRSGSYTDTRAGCQVALAPVVVRCDAGRRIRESCLTVLRHGTVRYQLFAWSELAVAATFFPGGGRCSPGRSQRREQSIAPDTRPDQQVVGVHVRFRSVKPNRPIAETGVC
jgi:hypothetical protein